MAEKKHDKPIPKTTKGKGANYRPTKEGAGMTKKGVAAYKRAPWFQASNCCYRGQPYG